ncbi:MAG: cytochrome c biogenesis protein CcsA [Coriobacteriia bacterium]
MSSIEEVLFWIAVAAYAASTLAMFTGLAFGRQRLLERAFLIASAGLVAHAAVIVVRWQQSGHFPYVHEYENVLVGSFAMVLVYVVIVAFKRNLSLAGVLVLPVVLLTMGYGLTQFTAPGPVTPPYQSGWLVVHVSFAWITYAAYSAVAGLAVALLVRARAERRGGQAKGIPSWVPASDSIDDLSLKLVAFGFLNNAVMIASGSIWAYRLWGSYWSWDPVETWSLLTWLAYGLYLHARLTLRWKGERVAWIALFALFGVMMAFWGVQLAPSSYHLFRDIGGNPPQMSRPR